MDEEFAYLTGLREAVKRLEREVEHNSKEIEVLWRCLHSVLKEMGAYEEESSNDSYDPVDKL